MTPHPENIPYGFCQCGCGQKTNIAKQTSARRGLVAGKPAFYLVGHSSRRYTTVEYAEPFKIASSLFPKGVYCRLIPLTQGQYAIVWESDYYWLMQVAWHAHWNPCTKSFYANRNLPRPADSGMIMPMHRLILGLNAGDGIISDHRNGVTLDNRQDNLRRADYSQNAMNRSASICSKSNLKGVYFNKRIGKWVANIQAYGIRRHLGYFNSREEAYAAYCAAAIAIHGEFARLS